MVYVMNDIKNSIWYEKYTPKTIEDVILPEIVKTRLLNAIKNEQMPNLGFWSAKPGLGKSCTAKAIIKSLNADAMWINASMDKGIDTLREKIRKFAYQESISDRPKLVVLDEADHLTKDSQMAYRGFIDECSSNCTFIFTGNYKSRIAEPLLNRLENYEFESFKPQEMGKPIYDKLINILVNENVEITADIQNGIKNIIKNYYPSIRAMIGALQRSVQSGKFEYVPESTNLKEVFEVMKSKDYLLLVQKVNALTNPDSMYEYLYDNINQFSNVPNAILSIAEGAKYTDQVRDKNLNLCATLVNLIKCL